MSEHCQQISCFAKDTPILMTDGQRKEVQYIRPGDLLMTRDGQGAVADMVSGYEKELLSIRYGDGVLRVTTHHPLLTGRGPLLAYEVRQGDLLLSPGGFDEEVLCVEYEPYEDMIYSPILNTREDGCWISAGGVWAGDFILMNTLTAKRLAAMEEEQYRSFLSWAESGGETRMSSLIAELDRLLREKT